MTTKNTKTKTNSLLDRCVKANRYAYDMAKAAGNDKANRNMRKAGRGSWSFEDCNLFSATFDRLYLALTEESDPYRVYMLSKAAGKL